MKRLMGLILFFLAAIASADTVGTTRTFVASVVPTIDTNIYASGDSIGGKLSLTNLNTPYIDRADSTYISGVISSVVITDKDKESANVDVLFFDADPSATTFTNNGLLTIADADNAKLICSVPITTHATFVDNGVSFGTNVNCPFVLASTTLYAAIVSRATPTYASASDLQLRVGILRD